MPGEWFDGPLPGLADVADAACVLRSRVGQRELIEIVTRADEHVVRDFQRRLWAAVTGDASHVTVSYPVEVLTPVACAVLACWLGMAPETVHDDIGGSVSHVVSGIGHRHDQDWHTDSTTWVLPNRYTLLGCLTAQDPLNMPTGVLPVRALDDALLGDQEAVAALRAEALPWRINFPDLPQLWGAVLDPAVPRWVQPAVEPLYNCMSPSLSRGVRSLKTALAGAVPWYEPATIPGQLLLFDNHRVLHRGPVLERSCGRELIRIKIGGRALA